jgi:hypothetical protein
LVTLLATEDPSTVENGDATPASLAAQRNNFLLKNRRVQGPRGDLWGIVGTEGHFALAGGIPKNK